MHTNMYQPAQPVCSPVAFPSTMTTYSDPENRYLQFSPATTKQPNNTRDTLSYLGKKLEDGTRKAQTVLENVCNHLRTGPSVTDVAATRLAQQGTKLLAEGGHERVFQQLFGMFPGEKLKKAYVCYLSTDSGPVMGTLYISTSRIAFCSDYPLRRVININCPYTYVPATPTGFQPELVEEWVYYKVVIMVEDLMAVEGIINRRNLSEKYIQISTKDGYQFWFMGFISYDKAFKHLLEAVHSPYVFIDSGSYIQLRDF
ncbi:hypothetical protein Ancab_007861 [Ancistrocladus abbreviatus]